MTGIQQVSSSVRPVRRCSCTGRVRAIGCVLDAEASSVPVLRRFACRVVRQWRLPDPVEEAVGLIVTELAANAVRHSGSAEVVLRMAAGDGRLVLHVQDSGRWRTPPASGGAGGEEACSGRGLELVAAFAAHFELRTTDGGTLASAELLLVDPAAPVCAVCG